MTGNISLTGMKVGEVYEVQPMIVVTSSSFPIPVYPKFLKLIGFSSQHLPVFEENGRFEAYDPKYNYINMLKESVL